jgi:hypothetical protein
MISTVDGRIDMAGVGAAMVPGEYEATGAKLRGDAWICGRVTMRAMAAGVSKLGGRGAGPRPVHVARRAESYAIVVDTRGSLRWASGDLDRDHLVVVTSERRSDGVSRRA